MVVASQLGRFRGEDTNLIINNKSLEDDNGDQPFCRKYCVNNKNRHAYVFYSSLILSNLMKVETTSIVLLEATIYHFRGKNKTDSHFRNREKTKMSESDV